MKKKTTQRLHRFSRYAERLGWAYMWFLLVLVVVLGIKVFIFGQDFSAQTLFSAISWTPLSMMLLGGIAESISIFGDIRRYSKEYKSGRTDSDKDIGQ